MPVDVNGRAAALDLAALHSAGGVVWSVSPRGLHANLVVLAAGAVIERHRNDSVAVEVVLGGTDRVAVDGAPTSIWARPRRCSSPRGTARSVRATSELRYLSVRAERQPLTISSRTRPASRSEIR
jgi:hypothetical protein